MADEEYVEEKEGESVYDTEGRKDLVEDDEMSPEEEGFMKGYEDADEDKDKKEDDDDDDKDDKDKDKDDEDDEE
jgi:hypothetical protein|tara:strand:+ start:216 stop:437 length:222 start_codon:yes stop_codon:yes gene_type:complete